MINISWSNSKLGPIPSVNLPPIVTCNQNAPCTSGKKCYACKGRFNFRNVKDSMWENYDRWNKYSPEYYFQDIENACVTSKYFRYHSAGDIPGPVYFYHMVKLAKKIPSTRFLCFTKQYHTVNAYIDQCGDLPENLVVVFSAWGDFLPDNPHNLPVAYVHLKSGEGIDHIPTDARKCSGYCASCIQLGQHCWNLEHGQSVVFNEH